MEVGENISVIASFSMPFRIKPVRFTWGGKLFEVKEITYTWKTREGQREIYHFSVTDGKTLYELAFDTKSLTWVLEKLET